MLTINLDQDTLTTLATGGFTLYAFRAALVNNTAARPAVWSRQAPFLPPLQLGWTDALSACLSTTPVTAGNLISALAPLAIEVGDTVQIDATTHEVLRTGGRATTFENRSPSAVTCALVQTVNGAPAPLCAFSVAPNDAQGAAIAGAILLFFSTADLPAGTIVSDPAPPPGASAEIVEGGGGSAIANQTQGLLVSDTSVLRTLAFSTKTGAWMWDGGVWAQTVDADAPVLPLLIRSTQTLDVSSATDFHAS